jgi:hypothetical protein
MSAQFDRRMSELYTMVYHDEKKNPDRSPLQISIKMDTAVKIYNFFGVRTGQASRVL